MHKVFAAILDKLEQGQTVVRVSVMKSSGSTPRTAGASMAVFTDGTIAGTIGGGTVENAAHVTSKEMAPGTSAVRDFDLTTKDAANLGMVCGGSMTVLMDSLLPNEENIALLKDILAHYAQRESQLFIITLSENGEVLRRELAPVPDDQPTTRVPFTRKNMGETVFIEPLTMPETVHFIGAGHVAQATAHLAAFTGFQTIVVDDRADFANQERFPETAEIRVEESLKSCLPDHLGAEDYVVIMTRGHKHDRDVLAQALKTGAGYIGMIGSKKKKAAVYESLLKAGYTQETLDTVHCPIGLTIGADTPEEIAVSIMGELIAHRANA